MTEAELEQFELIAESETRLDEVLERLCDIGVKVVDADRLVVSRWLDFYRSGLPLKPQLVMLSGWLEVDRRRRRGGA